MKNKKLTSFATNSIFTMIGLVAMNGISQLVVFPFLRNQYGIEQYGRILSLIGVINIVAVTVGASLNNARLIACSKGKGYDNKPYFILLVLASIVSFAICLISYKLIFASDVEIHNVLLCWLLMCLTIAKYYSEVEYRINLNYRGLLLYYIVISAGYVMGLLLTKLTSSWTFTLLCGELAGFILVCTNGNIYKINKLKKRESFTAVCKSVCPLVLAQLLLNLVFNSDRFLLITFCDSKSVAIYYIASAVGKMVSFATSSFNSVIIGFLVKKKDNISFNKFKNFSVIITMMAVLSTGACYIGSIVYTKLFYAADYDIAHPFFLWSNAAQVFYFASGLFTTVLLRYSSEKSQLKINISYVIMFCIITIPAVYIHKIWGYVFGLLFSNIFRYILAMTVCALKLKKLERCYNNEQY